MSSKIPFSWRYSLASDSSPIFLFLHTELSFFFFEQNPHASHLVHCPSLHGSFSSSPNLLISSFNGDESHSLSNASRSLPFSSIPPLSFSPAPLSLYSSSGAPPRAPPWLAGMVPSRPPSFPLL